MPASDERPISQFPTAMGSLVNALLFLSTPDGLGAYDSTKVTANDLAMAILGNFQFTQELLTDTKTIFGAINNLRVLIGTTTPTSQTGADGQFYIQYETVSNVDSVVGMYFKKDGEWLEISLGGGGGADYVECTQAQYDAWEQAGTLDPTVMYFITDGQSGGSSTLAGLSDVNLTNPTDGQLLKYNGTSGKWENAGIINDTTASASSVYSSNKTDTLLSAKQNSTDNSLDTTNKTIVGAINEHELDISTMNIASVTRVAATATTGATGNIALPYDNDGYTYIVGAMCTTSTYVPVVWVSSSTNGWFITIRGAETWSAAANQQVNIRYLVVKIKSM